MCEHLAAKITFEIESSDDSDADDDDDKKT